MDLTITLVLEHYGADLSVVPATGWHTIRCPFHDDAHGSARVNLDIGGFRCLACGVSGDMLKLIAEQENISRSEANEWAESVLGARYEVVRETTKRTKTRRRQHWRDRLLA